MKGELEMADDPIDNFMVFDKGDHFHLSAALRADQWVHFIDPADHLGPAAAGDPRAFLLDKQEIMNQETGQSPQEKVNR